MAQIDFKTYIAGIKNDLSIVIDDVFGILEKLASDVDKVKLELEKPDKNIAKVILEYLGWDDDKAKDNLEKLSGIDLQKHLNWLEQYCKEYNCTKEEALKLIIDG